MKKSNKAIRPGRVYPGTIQAHAYYDLDGKPQLQIEPAEMLRLRNLLKASLGHEPTVFELFEYVRKETHQ